MTGAPPRRQRCNGNDSDDAHLGVVVPGRSADRCRHSRFAVAARTMALRPPPWRLSAPTAIVEVCPPANALQRRLVTHARPGDSDGMSRWAANGSFRATFQPSQTCRLPPWRDHGAVRQMAEPIRPLTRSVGVHQALAPILDVAGETLPGPCPRNLRQLRQRSVLVVDARPSPRPRTAGRRRGHRRGSHQRAPRGVFSIEGGLNTPLGVAQASRPVRPGVRRPRSGDGGLQSVIDSYSARRRYPRRCSRRGTAALLEDLAFPAWWSDDNSVL